jgi:adenine nucleotide transporter 17
VSACSNHVSIAVILGCRAFWRGLGPALILVINPVVQYTVFEQLKNFLIASRTNKLRAAGAATAVTILSDWDFFFLGAVSKLGTLPCCNCHLPVENELVQLPQV